MIKKYPKSFTIIIISSIIWFARPIYFLPIPTEYHLFTRIVFFILVFAIVMKIIGKEKMIVIKFRKMPIYYLRPVKLEFF